MTHEQKIAMASRRFNNAAHALAASVDVADRLANDPDFMADRSAWADARRAEMRIEDLRRYREAESALIAVYREGDCEHCRVPLAKCRDDRGRVCCEDCTHPRPAVPAHENGRSDR